MNSITTRNVFLYLIAILLAALFVFPFLWLVDIAFKSPADLGAIHILWLPSQWQWQNFSQALSTIPFGMETFNSACISFLYASLSTLSSATVGFGFARLKAPGKNALFLLMVSMLLLPPIITLLPSYIIYSRLGLIGTYWPWILGGLASTPFISFLFRQFFSSLPRELEEAAIIDGAGYARIFAQMFLPLSFPVVATAFVLSFTWTWGDYITQSLYLNGNTTTLAVGIATGYVSPVNSPVDNLIAAGSILFILPVLLIFFFAQRAFTRGIVTTGMR